MNDDHMWDRLINILLDETQESITYVYRVGPNGALVKPYLLKTDTYPDLLETLIHRYGGGRFKLLIRRGRCMIFSGEILVGDCFGTK